jgi:hypothetical protein
MTAWILVCVSCVSAYLNNVVGTVQYADEDSCKAVKRALDRGHQMACLPVKVVK